MDELDKALEISLTGKARDDALAACREQLACWAQPMPPVAPLVIDFGLADFRGTGLIEYWIANETEAGYCGKYLFVFDAQTCPMHGHEEKHETFFIVKGRVRMTCGGRTQTMNEGDVLPVPPGRLHSFTGLGPALLLELSTPCRIDDNAFENPAIPIGKNRGKGQAS